MAASLGEDLPHKARVFLRREPRPSPLCANKYKQAFLPYISNLATRESYTLNNVRLKQTNKGVSRIEPD